MMPHVTDTKALRPWSGDRAPADWGLGDGQAVPWEYAPAPESKDIVAIKPRYGLFIDGREVKASDGGWFKSVNPATEEVIAEVAKATTADVDRAIRAARRAQKTRWGSLPGKERAKYLFRIARILQERAREFAVLESMDSGKPITESRDVDIPLVANHFWYYAGWADKLEYAIPGRVAKPLGVAAQVIPWNFPMLMLACKIAPALEPRRGQGRLHRLDRRREADPQGNGGDRQGADARARWQGREHRLRGRGARPGGRGHRQRHLLQPGRGLLRRLAAARAGVG